MKKILIIVLFFVTNMMHAQLKVGKDANFINKTNNLEIEAISSDKVQINKTDGRVFIENKQNAVESDSVTMRNAYGEIRQISINRLMGFQDFDGDSLPNNLDLDDDGDGIADVSDRCPLVYGCPSNPVGGATHGCPVNCNFNYNNNAMVLNCTSPSNTGTLVVGVASSGVSSTISYTGGVGGTHSGQTVSSTGVTGLTATLASGSFATGSGNLTYTISGTPSNTGTANFAINIGGKTCVLSRNIQSPISLNCSNPNNSGSFTVGVSSSGVSTIYYTGGNGGTYSGQTVSSTGVTGLTATLNAGTFANGAGSVSYTISGVPASSGNAYFAINVGGQSCTIVRNVSGLIANFDNICPPIACKSRDCQSFGIQYNTAGGGTDGFLWDMSGNGVPAPGNNLSEGGYFDLPYVMTAGISHTIEVRWLTFAALGLWTVPMGFSIKTGSCSGNVIASSQALRGSCIGLNSTCENWRIDYYTITPSTNISRLYFVAWGGNGGNDFVLIDYFKIYR